MSFTAVALPRMFRLCGTALVWFLVAAMAAPAAAHEQGDGEGGEFACLHGKLELAEDSEAFAAKAYDESSGRDLRHFPPDRIVDHEHMRLELRFEDLNERRFSAVETLRFTPIACDLASLELDAVGLEIHTVTIAGETVEHFHDDEHLTLRFDPPLPVGESHEVVVTYDCIEPYDGMTFTPAASRAGPDAPGYGPEVHTQGQTEHNRHWFVCHDFPNERLTTELIVDVPAGFMVSGNGRLVSHEERGDREVWHWLQDEPHVNYLVSLVIGRFDRVELPHDRVPMTVWAPRGTADLVVQTYGNTPAMLDLFEQRFGVPYPWDRYDQLIVKNFGAGGMENTSATTMYPTAIFDETALLDDDLDGLISHELAHQWMGDLITCKSWEHIWLNEGWATFSTSLWYEHRDGEDGYLDSIRGRFGVARRDKTSNAFPMVSPVYDSPWETFRRAANPYPKGASILHMLRMMLGEEVFWRGVRTYMQRHTNGVVETADFRYAMEDASGLGLEWFFEQWCYRPGTPELRVKVDYDGAARDLLVHVRQTQHIDERTPAFRFTLPVHVQLDDGTWQVHRVRVQERDATFRTTLAGPPAVVAIDPHLHVLKTIDVDKPLALWHAQIDAGPTVVARHAAIEALAAEESAGHVARLADLIRDDALRYTLRRTAADTLAAFGSERAHAAVRDLLDAGIDDARVRDRLVRALAQQTGDGVVARLAESAGGDPSYAVRERAIKALADHDATDHADLIAELVHFPSQHDKVRNAALRALATLDDARGLALALQYAAYGHMDRSRPVAIRVIGDLAHHDHDRAVEALLAYLRDPESRAVEAAGRALAELGDDRAKAPLQAMSETHPDPARRERAVRWLERLDESER